MMLKQTTLCFYGLSESLWRDFLSSRLMFMTANQFGLEAKDVTSEVDWRPIMKMILNEADTTEDDFEKMKIEVRPVDGNSKHSLWRNSSYSDLR